MDTTTLIQRINAEFALLGINNRMDDGTGPLLYVESRDGRLLLCDYNGSVPLDEQDALGGGIEEIARNWIEATA